ncbi:Lpg1974 family pore-forming outer membrane protein [Aeoliella mucimassa]|uniref:Legionella pneumophila major outer membrane protein n=1 Tax=Aeoliella mucimassa TaxID=2527972 RepID=A0A518AN55_9BACT|nr:Lpg1974 family pore-forming outer membrane protein [Aeoliella mucimassa]QDU56136.1 hypothetical protein Pan181_23400 [Aeoliella mucimassa]
MLRTLITASVAIACGCLFHFKCEAQEVDFTTYNDLLERVAVLEQQNAQRPVAASQYGQGGSCGNQLSLGQSDACCQSSSCGREGVYFMYEQVLVAPFQTNSTAIIAQNDPVIEHIGFGWNMEPSNRIEFGYLGGKGCLGWRTRYWQFDHSETLEVDSSVGLVQDEGAIVFSSTNSGDTIIGVVDVDTAVMTQQIEMDVLDFELQRQFSSSFLVSGGLRMAKANQTYFAVTDSGTVNSSINFEGFGPTLAGEFRYPVRHTRFSVYGIGRTSLLYGQQDFIATDSDGGEVLSIPNAGQLVGNLELQLGAEYRFGKYDRCFIRTGAEAQFWSNLGSPNPSATYADDSDEAVADDPRGEDLGFIGLTISGGFSY